MGVSPDARYLAEQMSLIGADAAAVDTPTA
jgi:hypothetical protein